MTTSRAEDAGACAKEVTRPVGVGYDPGNSIRNRCRARHDEELLMNRRRLLFIGIAALAVGSLVSMKVYRLLRAQSGPPNDLVDFLVAANDIPVGAKIEDRDLKVVKLPPEDLAGDAF